MEGESFSFATPQERFIESRRHLGKSRKSILVIPDELASIIHPLFHQVNLKEADVVVDSIYEDGAGWFEFLDT